MRPTASSFALLHACGYSFRDDVTLPPAETSDEARRGNAFGLLVEHAINGGTAPPISELVAALPEDEARRLVAMWGHAKAWLDEHKRLGWRAEVAFAWDPATDVGRELPRTSHRDYTGATPGELCGTADIVAIDGDDLVLDDWKTSAPGAPEADATAQLEGLALMAARAWGYDSVRIRTLKVTAERGVEVIEGETIDMFGLAEIAERLRTDLARIPGAEPVPGEHCKGRFCKALAVCPSTQALVAQIPIVLPPTSLVRKKWAFSPIIESVDHLQALLEMKAIAKAYVESVSSAITAYVGEKELLATDGTTIRATFRTMPRLDAKELTELAREKGATEDEISRCVHARIEPNGVRAFKVKKGKVAA